MGITVFPTPTSSSGGGYSKPLPFCPISTTSTWCPAVSGCVAVHVIGGGGNGCCFGGGGGGYSLKFLTVTDSDCYCATVGAAASASCFCNISGATVSMTSCGGAHNLGGCASGGDFNHCGSPGGLSNGGANTERPGGGGAVNIFGLSLGGSGLEGGNGGCDAGGGGSGVGGHGGQAYCFSLCSAPMPGQGGGSAWDGSGHVCICTSKTGNNPGAAAAFILPRCGYQLFRFISQWGPGGGSQITSCFCNQQQTTSVPGPGGGGHGGHNGNGIQQNGGAFAGGGGAGKDTGVPGYGGYPGGGSGGFNLSGSYGAYGAVLIEYVDAS